MMARAIDILCFCPPDNVIPRSPIIVLKFFGKSIMLSKITDCFAASWMRIFFFSSFISSVNPKEILLPIVSLKRKTS